MSLRSKVLATAASLAIVGGVGTAGALSAGAATPSCGHRCIDVFSREFGTHRTPGYVLDVKQQAARTGQPIIMWRTSNSDPAEDFTVSFQGTVSEFYAAGLATSALNLHYGDGSLSARDEPAYELEYSPNGAGTGLCVGVAATARAGEGVSLQPCGVSARTTWVDDETDSPFTVRYDPLINGSDTNFSHPFVLTYPRNGYPTDRPRPQVQVTNLTGFSNGRGPIVGTVIDAQLWGADWGVLR